jgi:hypothetical protein
MCRPVTWSTKPSIQWLPGVKQPGRDPGHSYPSGAEIKYGWCCTSPLYYVRLLAVNRGSFIFLVSLEFIQPDVEENSAKC